jgi:glycosyltransferase involved in cell wall biosynthesis
MKVLFIITNLLTGGAEMMLLKLLSRIDRSHFQCRVISLVSLGTIGPRIEATGIPVLEIGMQPGWVDMTRWLHLVKEIHAFKPAIVQTWMYHANLLGGAAAKLAGTPHVVWNLRHCNLDPSLNKLHTRLTARFCAGLSHWIPTRILSNSGVSAEVHQLLGYDGRRMLIIPNGFEIDRFKPDIASRVAFRNELGLTPHTPLIGLMGRYDAQKNHAGFLRAAAIIARERSDVRFVLCGRGVDVHNRQLASIIGDNGLERRLHLLGERSDMQFVTAALDIACSSSLGEAFPNTVGEAMACGVPCVVTDVGDSAVIVGNTGSVVPPRDDRAFARAVLGLLDMPEKERRDLGARARQRIVDNYSLDHVVREYEMLYESLVQGKLRCAV